MRYRDACMRYRDACVYAIRYGIGVVRRGVTV